MDQTVKKKERCYKCNKDRTDTLMYKVMIEDGITSVIYKSVCHECVMNLQAFLNSKEMVVTIPEVCDGR